MHSILHDTFMYNQSICVCHVETGQQLQLLLPACVNNPVHLFSNENLLISDWRLEANQGRFTAWKLAERTNHSDFPLEGKLLTFYLSVTACVYLLRMHVYLHVQTCTCVCIAFCFVISQDEILLSQFLFDKYSSLKTQGILYKE